MNFSIIENERTNKTKDEIIAEIKQVDKNKIIFYGNNLLANPNIKDILKAFIGLKINKKPVVFESQSGFDGRLLAEDSELAYLLKKAGFVNIRIAWDNAVSDAPKIKSQLRHLISVGYQSNNISIFMIYNYVLVIHEMIEKIKCCFKRGVQIIDCRFRPLDRTEDNYKLYLWRKGQTSEDYFIHNNWTDKEIRLFRKIVRIHNITIRYVWSKIKDPKKIWEEIKDLKDPLKLLYYYEKKIGSRKDMEKWSTIHSTYKFFGLGRPPSYEKIDSSRKISKRILLMNKVKNYCKKQDISFSLKGLKIREQEQRLLEFFNKHIIK